MRSILCLTVLALALTVGLFAVAKAAPADALAAYGRSVVIDPQTGLGCGCPGCSCVSCSCG
jgi:hypothetical protein